MNGEDAISLLLFILIIVGLVGTVINIVVYSAKSMRQTSTFRYLLYLSVFDLLVLIVCASDALARFGTISIEIRLQSTLLCRAHTYLTYFLTQSSSNILMMISIDRALLVTNKLKFNNATSRLKPRHLHVSVCFGRFKPNRVDLVIGLLLVFLALVNIHYLVLLPLTFQLIADPSTENQTQHYLQAMCFPESDQRYSEFLIKVWTWIDLCIYGLMPFLVVTVCSIVIIKRTTQNDVRVRLIITGSPCSAKTSSVYGSSCNSSKTTAYLLSKQTVWQTTGFYKRMQRNRHVLNMLIATNFYFLFTSLPYFVLAVIYQGKESGPYIQPLVHLFLYSNNSVRFIFNGFTSEKYRLEFRRTVDRIKFLGCRFRKNRLAQLRV